MAEIDFNPTARQLGAMLPDHGALERAISDTVLGGAIAARTWAIEQRSTCGRTLVAKRAIAEGEVIFSERPLVAACASSSGPSALRGSVPAVALELLAASSSPQDAAHLLQPKDAAWVPVLPPEEICHENPTDDEDAHLERRLHRFTDFDDWVRSILTAMESRRHGTINACGSEDMSPPPRIPAVRWALGVAAVNSHGAAHPTRGVLGLLSSMPEHSCRPSCRVDIAPASSGSVISLHAKRPIEAGEVLSISYVNELWPRRMRQRVLRLQYGFQCGCDACVQDAPQQVASLNDAKTPRGPAPPAQSMAELVLEPFLPKLLGKAMHPSEVQLVDGANVGNGRS